MSEVAASMPEGGLAAFHKSPVYRSAYGNVLLRGCWAKPFVDAAVMGAEHALRPLSANDSALGINEAGRPPSDRFLGSPPAVRRVLIMTAQGGYERTRFAGGVRRC